MVDQRTLIAKVGGAGLGSEKGEGDDCDAVGASVTRCDRW